MKRIAILLGVVALIVALSAPTALGVMWHQCAGKPCSGTRSANYLDERHGNGTPDAIYGQAGRDHLEASDWTRDRDIVSGNSGRDTLNVRDGDTKDRVSGGPNRDVCTVDSRSEVGASCEVVRGG